MNSIASPLTIQPQSYFSILGEKNEKAWTAIKGQRICHLASEYGTIDEVLETCVWIKFENSKERRYFPRKALLNDLFSELSIPEEYKKVICDIQAFKENLRVEKEIEGREKNING